MNVRERSREVGKALHRYVTSRITTGQWRPGDRIPTERELADMFGGGRSSIRRALEELEKEGVIGREVGRGTFVRNPPAAMPSSPASPLLAMQLMDASGTTDLGSITRLASPNDVMELRLALEPAVIELAVMRASTAEIDSLYECIEQGRRSRTLEEFEHWDDVLHRTIATASRNPLFVAVYSIIGAVRLEAQWGELKQRTLSEEAKADALEEHQRIVDSVRARNSSEARQAMVSHMEHIRKSLYGRGE